MSGNTEATLFFGGGGGEAGDNRAQEKLYRRGRNIHLGRFICNIFSLFIKVTFLTMFWGKSILKWLDWHQPYISPVALPVVYLILISSHFQHHYHCLITPVISKASKVILLLPVLTPSQCILHTPARVANKRFWPCHAMTYIFSRVAQTVDHGRHRSSLPSFSPSGGRPLTYLHHSTYKPLCILSLIFQFLLYREAL